MRAPVMRELIAAGILRTSNLAGQSKAAHQAVYRLLARILGDDSRCHFMNLGFDSLRFRHHPLALEPQDSPDRLHIQLYDELLRQVPVARQRVLEVGCGRGGGCAYVQRYLGAHHVVGVDLNYNGLAICGREFGRSALQFVNGDTERLPFAENSFGAVVCIESSHAYSSMHRFLDETARVLRPGGYLAHADLRWDRPRGNGDRSGLEVMRRQFSESTLELVGESDLSSGVCDALTAGKDDRTAFIQTRLPPGLRWLFAELALPGGIVHQHLVRGDLRYWMSVLRKPEGLAPAYRERHNTAGSQLPCRHGGDANASSVSDPDNRFRAQSAGPRSNA
jgi:SAM-dependent methyltransferase